MMMFIILYPPGYILRISIMFSLSSIITSDPVPAVVGIAINGSGCSVIGCPRPTTSM